MKRIALLVLGIVSLVPAARAQSYGLISGWCDQGAVFAITQGLKSTNTLQGVIPYCTISVFNVGTTTLATLYSNATGTPLANPFTATNTGYWQFYAANTNSYTIQGSGGIPPNTYLTPTVLPGSGGSGGGGGSSPPQYSVQYALNNSGQFGSDPTITINPTQHIFQAPEVFVPGTGTGLIGLTSGSSGNTIYQTAQSGTATWYWYWPTGPPAITGYCLTGTSTGLGAFVGCPLVATAFPGATIDAQVGAALTACSNNCEVDIPPGSYIYSNSITAPLNLFSTYRIRLLPGAVLNYTGSGCAVTATVVTGPTEGDFEIWGGQINGNSGAVGGVCVQPTNKFHIHDMTIVGFTNSSGAGIWLEGPNAGTVENNFISNSGIGVLATPTFCTGASCTPSTVGSPYSPNNINIINNVLPANGWGIFYDDVTSGSGLTGALGVNISGNDVEEATIGGINIGRSHAATIGPNNYFELDPIGIQVGISSGSNYFASNGTRIVGNYFTVTTIQKYDIVLENTMDTIIEGNSQDYASENSSNCFINGLPYVADASGGEINTVVGNNHVELAGVGNYLCENGSGVIALTGTGSYTQLNQNYFPLLVNSNYAIVSSGSSDTGVAVSGNSTTSSACFVTPQNATAGAVGLGSVYFIMTGNNVGTFYHPSSVAGTRWNIWCSGVQN